MTCPNANQIAAQLAGAADQASIDALDAHLDTCEACRTLLANLARGLTAIDGKRAKPAKPAQTALPAPGTCLGRYEIVRLLGVGGLGAVFEARDTTLRRRVALKVLRPDAYVGDVDVLLAEAQRLARVQHPNVVAIYDAGFTDGQRYICMEYVQGHTLRVAAQRTPAQWRALTRMVRRACDGVAAIHRAGLAHLDLKPENLLIADDGRVLVTDFGLAAGGTRPSPYAVGTPAFMAPEQRAGARDLSQADQYALALTLRDVLGDHAPPWLLRVVSRATQLVPTQRYASINAFACALDAGLSRRRRALVAGSATLLLAMAVTLTFLRAAPASPHTPAARPTDRVAAPPNAHWPETGHRTSATNPSKTDAATTARANWPASAYARSTTPTAPPGFAGPSLSEFGRALGSAQASTPVTAETERDAASDVTLVSTAQGARAVRTDTASPVATAPCISDGPLHCTLPKPQCASGASAVVRNGCWVCVNANCQTIGLPGDCSDGSALQCSTPPPTDCKANELPFVVAGCWQCQNPMQCAPKWAGWSGGGVPSTDKPNTPPRPRETPLVVPRGRCGNNVCDGRETPETCRDCCHQNADGSCVAACGNGMCEVGEDHASCKADCCITDANGSCVPYCGNFVCELNETHDTCPSDCCAADSNPSRCVATCGDGMCANGENHANCAADCCEQQADGSCVPECGNGMCEVGESARSCASDCD